MSKSTRWCFTLNNYTPAEEAAIQAWKCSYLIYGREVGECGTPHLQGFVTFGGRQQRLSGVKKLCPRAHWEPAQGTSAQAAEYCKKDGDTFEKGKTPFPGKRSDLEEACDMIKDGKRLREVADELSSTYVKFSRGIKDLALTLTESYEHDDVRGVWIWGPPGVGKSRYARREWPDIYLKAQNKWFDGYDGEPTILLDDLDKIGIGLSHHLKIWADRYACTGETKGGTVHLKHEVFVVTSNYSIEELWPDDEKLQKALKRRFKVIHMENLHD